MKRKVLEQYVAKDLSNLSVLHQESVRSCLARRSLASLKRIQHRQLVDWSHQVTVRWSNKCCVTKWKCRAFSFIARVSPLYPVVFNMFLENILQRALTPRHLSENDRLAICSLLTTSICWEAVKKTSNNSLIDWRKQLLDTAWKAAATKAKWLSTASSQDLY